MDHDLERMYVQVGSATAAKTSVEQLLVIN